MVDSLSLIHIFVIFLALERGTDAELFRQGPEHQHQYDDENRLVQEAGDQFADKGGGKDALGCLHEHGVHDVLAAAGKAAIGISIDKGAGQTLSLIHI